MHLPDGLLGVRQNSMPVTRQELIEALCTVDVFPEGFLHDYAVQPARSGSPLEERRAAIEQERDALHTDLVDLRLKVRGAVRELRAAFGAGGFVKMATG
jgi:hypothetical protein